MSYIKRFGTKYPRDVGDTDILLPYVPWVPRIQYLRQGILDIADHAQCRIRYERIDESLSRVRLDQHVALVDRLKTADARTVETDAVDDNILVQLLDRNRDMLPQSRNIREFQIDELQPLVLGILR